MYKQMRSISHSLPIAVLTILILCSIGSSPVAGQDKIEQLRLNYITRELDLTGEELGKFTPIYQQYVADMRSLRQNFMPQNDADVSTLTVDRQLEFEQKKLDLKKRFVPQFERAIGHNKLNRMVHAEENFKRNVMRAIHHRQMTRGNQMGEHRMERHGKGAGR
jgi:hypothetical protein